MAAGSFCDLEVLVAAPEARPYRRTSSLHTAPPRRRPTAAMLSALLLRAACAAFMWIGEDGHKQLLPASCTPPANHKQTCNHPPQRTFNYNVVDAIANVSHGKVLLLDIGANDGAWTVEIFHHARPKHGAYIDSFLFEPQGRFNEVLGNLASTLSSRLEWVRRLEKPHLNVTHLRMAAWLENKTMSFWEPPVGGIDRSQTASLIGDYGSKHYGREVKVPAIDLADFIIRHGSDAALTIIKMDIEGAEYSVLPRLLTSGALCMVDYLNVEWHLSALPDERRLTEGMGLRLMLESTLRACRPSRLKMMMNEDYLSLNVGAVYGLSELARLHECNENRSDADVIVC